MSEQLAELQARVERIEKAVRTMAWWLVQTPGVWGVQDGRGIDKILDGDEQAERVEAER